MGIVQYLLAFLVTLGVLVIVHELGHYVVARWSGVRILRFAVGFGKPIFVRADRRGTEWAVAAIPLGGYVRMLDERDGNAAAMKMPEDVSFNHLHPAWRIAISLGGPFANFLLAIVVYWLLAVVGSLHLIPILNTAPEDSPAATAGLKRGMEIVAVDGETVRTWQQINMALAARMGDTGDIVITAREHDFERQLPTRDFRLPIQDWHRGVDEPELLRSLGFSGFVPAVFVSIEPGSAAEAAGLQPLDQLIAIDGQPVDDWNAFSKIIVESPGQTLALTVKRGGAQIQIDATPGTRTIEGEQYGFLGVGRPLREVAYGPFEAIFQGIDETVGTVALTLNLLKKMIFGQVSLKNLSGPITIAQVAGDSASIGWQYFLGVLALLSVSLGVLNLLPIPILDGGHVIYASAEWITGKPVSERVQILGFQIGLFMVGGLMILALFNDFTRVFAS